MPPVLRPEAHFRPYRRNVWRVIEGQSRSSTVRLVDTFAEHDTLEALLEDSKPPVPEDCRHLDFQFWSPFRYGRYPKSSRFRRAGRTPGVWYGAEEPLTAISETVWKTLAFYRASEGTPLPRRPIEHTAVMADIRTDRALDLTAPELAGAGNWTDPEDYAECLALSDAMRAVDGEAIRYASVRHPEPAANVAVLCCGAFAQPRPIQHQTWQVTLSWSLVRVSCETLNQRFMFAPGETALRFSDGTGPV